LDSGVANLDPAASALAAFNVAPADAAERDMLACCASQTFAQAIAARRPYRDPVSLQNAVDAEFVVLSWEDIVEAMNEHPRIGDRKAASEGWSASEQSGAVAAGDQVRRELAEGNVRYEERFGHVFLICATGLSGQQMLDQLQARLANDEQAERAIVRAELRKITQLRVGKRLNS
jgi:2-oxo-4-hydroxy-4-carboxy-5-ureidoimidazoline decarboxylase